MAGDVLTRGALFYNRGGVRSGVGGGASKISALVSTQGI